MITGNSSSICKALHPLFYYEFFKVQTSDFLISKINSLKNMLQGHNPCTQDSLINKDNYEDLASQVD